MNYVLKSKIDETAASVEKIENTPKAVAFRATCTSNLKNWYSESPGKHFLMTSSQNIVSLIKTINSIQLFGKILNTISVMLTMHQMENSLVRMMESIHFMQLQRYILMAQVKCKFTSMVRKRLNIISGLMMSPVILLSIMSALMVSSNLEKAILFKLAYTVTFTLRVHYVTEHISKVISLPFCKMTLIFNAK